MVSRGLLVILVATLMCACTFDTRQVDSTDAGVADAAADAPLSSPHLLLSEVKTSNDAALREFIEIVNPTPSAIDLRDYYLADDMLYARIPAIIAGESASLAEDDFIARFPVGASIGAGEVLVIAIRTTVSRPFPGASFAVAPADNTPPLEPAFPGSIPTFPNLDNDAGEGIALFRWNGETDLVTDVDLFNAGFNISAENALPDKTAVSVDGPDADDTPSVYGGDSFTMPLPTRSNGVNEAFVRIAGEVGELTANGNGPLGHDETSEDIRASWGFAVESPGEASF